jgi:hypothetical protein
MAKELGVDFETLRRWVRNAEGEPQPAGPRSELVAVQVVDERATRSVSVISPGGFRVDGLSLAEAVAMLRALS